MTTTPKAKHKRLRRRLLIASAVIAGTHFGIYIAAEIDMARERAARRYLALVALTRSGERLPRELAEVHPVSHDATHWRMNSMVNDAYGAKPGPAAVARSN